ncbi:diguanylate cyclase [Granulicella cerasi]|uniref:diguanylate cyclase n=1 Tax=Granulicella cerasi TaxID=741063 RepID=A0ABW1ZA89_9BACT
MDPQTVVWLAIILFALSSVSFLLIHLSNQRLRGVGWLAATFFAGLLGWGTSAAQPLPLWARQFAGDFFTLLGFVLMHVAVMEMMTKRKPVPSVGILLLIAVCVIDGGVALHLLPNAARSLMPLTLVIKCVRTTYLLLRAAHDEETLPAWFSSAVFIAFGLFQLVRFGMLVSAGLHHRPQSDGLLVAHQVALLVASLTIASSFFWMSNVQLSMQLQLMAGTDPLTRLYNRRTFLNVCDKELSTAIQRHRPFSVLMIDLDHFKKINDEFGHAVGDSALVAVVEAMQAAVRGSDTLARWGGEEFSALLPQADMSSARIAAERVRSNVEKLLVPLALQINSPRSLQLTVSIGLASYQAGDTVESLMQRADEHLYRAKQRGRNCVFPSST